MWAWRTHFKKSHIPAFSIKSTPEFFNTNLCTNLTSLIYPSRLPYINPYTVYLYHLTIFFKFQTRVKRTHWEIPLDFNQATTLQTQIKQTFPRVKKIRFPNYWRQAWLIKSCKVSPLANHHHTNSLTTLFTSQLWPTHHVIQKLGAFLNQTMKK